MEKSKAELEETLSRLEVDMEGGKKAWLEPLRELIAKVNVNFGKFFANMQCVGEVSLDHGEDEVIHLAILETEFVLAFLHVNLA